MIVLEDGWEPVAVAPEPLPGLVNKDLPSSPLSRAIVFTKLATSSSTQALAAFLEPACFRPSDVCAIALLAAVPVLPDFSLLDF